MDLSKVTFPTFVLEPRSMLERITDFMSHPDLIFGQGFLPFCVSVILISNPQCRDFRRSRGAVYPCVAVLPCRLAYQTERCQETVRDIVLTSKKVLESSSDITLFSENSFAVGMIIPTVRKGSTSQSKARGISNPTHLPTNVLIVSHHPPISAFFYISPANHVRIIGELRPKSKFLGNSVSTTMEGENRVTLLGKPDDGGA